MELNVGSLSQELSHSRSTWLARAQNGPKTSASKTRSGGSSPPCPVADWRRIPLVAWDCADSLRRQRTSGNASSTDLVCPRCAHRAGIQQVHLGRAFSSSADRRRPAGCASSVLARRVLESSPVWKMDLGRILSGGRDREPVEVVLRSPSHGSRRARSERGAIGERSSPRHRARD